MPAKRGYLPPNQEIDPVGCGAHTPVFSARLRDGRFDDSWDTILIYLLTPTSPL